MSHMRNATDRFDVAVERRDGAAVVRPIGELDMASAPQLREIVGGLRHTHSSLLIDLKGVTFLDSTGLRLIWDVDAMCRHDGLDLKLAPGPPEVMRVFELTGLTRRLPFIQPA
jgi:anti-anti-sigma factor